MPKKISQRELAARTIKLWRDLPDNHPVDFDIAQSFQPLKFKDGYVYMMGTENYYCARENDARNLWRELPTWKHGEYVTFRSKDGTDDAYCYGRGKKKYFTAGCKRILFSELNAIARQRKWKRLKKR